MRAKSLAILPLLDAKHFYIKVAKLYVISCRLFIGKISTPMPYRHAQRILFIKSDF